MAWEGKTLAEICAQLKDPARNGGRKVEELIPPTRCSAGPGIPASAALPARSRRPARWSKPG
jgi:hypothetical protein